MTPFIVVGFNAAGEPLFLWPFGSPSRWAAWSRGRIPRRQTCQFQHGAVAARRRRNDRAPRSCAGRARAARRPGRLLKLANQPLTWAGTTNPFALLPHQRVANFGFSGALVPRFRCAAACAHQRRRPQEDAQEGTHVGQLRRSALRARRTTRTMYDACSMPSSNKRARACARMACRTCSQCRACGASSKQPRPNRADGSEPLIELYALSVDDIIVATMGGIVGDGRFCAMFNSIIAAAASPSKAPASN